MIRHSVPHGLVTTRAGLNRLVLCLACSLASTAGCYQDAPVSTPQASMAILVTLLDDPQAIVRLTAAEALGKIGDGKAGPFLLPVLHDPDPKVRAAAARSVGALSVTGKEVETELAALLADPDPPVRHAAAQALGIREATPTLTSALTGLLVNPDPAVRQAAGHALLLVERHGALQALSRAVTDEDPTVRQWAVAALGETGDVRATPVLLERLRHDPVASVRAEAAYRLQYVGEGSAASEVDAIVEEESSQDVKRWAGKGVRPSGGGPTPVQRVD